MFIYLKNKQNRQKFFGAENFFEKSNNEGNKNSENNSRSFSFLYKGYLFDCGAYSCAVIRFHIQSNYPLRPQ